MLLDQASAREERLLALLEQLAETKAPRPTLVPNPMANVLQPDFDVNSLSDVAAFDEDSDAALMQQQEALGREIEEGFAEIAREHVAAHSEPA